MMMMDEEEEEDDDDDDAGKSHELPVRSVYELNY